MNLRFSSALIALVVAATAVADAQIDWSAHQWMAPGPNDLRGPCPGLNTLANHGFLPRDGRNITVPDILDAGFNGYHMEPNLLLVAAKVGFLTSRDPNTLSLADIAQHGNIEHDASLSREDFALGDHIRFNETIFSTLANSNPGSDSDVYNSTSAGQVQHARLVDSIRRNPNITNTHFQSRVRSFESAFYLSVMGDSVRGEAPKKFVQIFFREERLPIEEGWQRSTDPLTLQNVFGLSDKIMDASNWEPTGEDCFEILLSPDQGPRSA
ncbi:hypothetical protein V5O48_005820 [Marasmius crinis-equi]|uniref:Heme haloperoxidase family profile domain-containing protein n=1 Tax=Marasmius crinis-equi TaxID=585013 RepID=A0ABR3FL76_9AGAR